MAKEGMTLCLGMIIIAFLVWGVWLFEQSQLTLAVAIVATIVAVFFLYFFRDPERVIPNEENVLVSPADGQIVAIKSLPSHPFIQATATQISIFLSPFDVHINRIPATGEIDYVKYKKGRFLAAYKESASEQNEQTEVGLITKNGARIVFKQIAGVLARRINCRLEKGQKVSAGDRYGMIKFGSRVDLVVPSSTEISVAVGQHVAGGVTIMGRLANRIYSNTEPSSSKQTHA